MGHCVRPSAYSSFQLHACSLFLNAGLHQILLRNFINITFLSLRAFGFNSCLRLPVFFLLPNCYLPVKISYAALKTGKNSKFYFCPPHSSISSKCRPQEHMVHSNPYVRTVIYFVTWTKVLRQTETGSRTTH